MSNHRASNRTLLLAARLVSGAVVIGILNFGSPVLIPLGIALLIAFMLQPLMRKLRRWGLGVKSATTIITLGIVVTLGSLSWLIAGQVQRLTAEIPAYKKNLVEKISEIRRSFRGGSLQRLESTMSDVMHEVQSNEKKELNQSSRPAPAEPQPVVIARDESESMQDGLSLAGSLLGPMGTSGLVFILVILLLLKWSDLRGRLISIIGQSLTSTTTAIHDAGDRVSRYLGMQFLVNLGTGIIVWIGLSLIQLPYAGLMGLCAGLFRYVPYVGPVAAAALPLLMSFVTGDGWRPLIMTGSLFLVLELLLNNFVEPWLYGSKLGVSEIGIILATVVWTFLWGPAGLVLATPLTVCLVVLGKNVRGLSFISSLLSDGSQLPVHSSLTQRLLAGDTLEAADLLASQRETHSFDQTYDQVIVPALAQLRHEQRLGHLDNGSASTIARKLPVMLHELADDRPAIRLQSNSAFAVWGLCPMTDVLLAMLPDRFQSVPCDLRQFNSTNLTSDITSWLVSNDCLGIAVIHLDASDYPRLAAAVRRIRRVLPDIPVLAGRWGEQTFTTSEKEELSTMGASGHLEDPAQLKSWLMPRAVDVAMPVPEAALGSV